MQEFNIRLRFVAVGAYFIFCAITMVNAQGTFPLPGKIAVNFDDSFFVYDNSTPTKIKFKIRKDENIIYSGFRWLNKSNCLIGIEYLQTSETGINQGNIACFDLSGNLVKRIYESVNGEIAGNAYLSRNDKRLLFTTVRKANIDINPLGGLNPVKSMVVVNFTNNKVIKEIKDVGTSLSFELHESPWLYDENRFIYSISGEKNVVLEGKPLSENKELSGIFMYDLGTNVTKLLIPGALLGICSPVDLRIGYIKDHAIWVMNLKDNSAKRIYIFGARDRVVNLHWTPDGNFIYMAYYKYNSVDDFEPHQVLIETKTNMEIPFKSIDHGFQPYTWKR